MPEAPEFTTSRRWGSTPMATWRMRQPTPRRRRRLRTRLLRTNPPDGLFDVSTDNYRPRQEADLEDAKTVESRGLSPHQSPEPSAPHAYQMPTARPMALEPTVSSTPVSSPRTVPGSDPAHRPSSTPAGARPLPSAGSRVIGMPQAYGALSHLDVKARFREERLPPPRRSPAEKLILGAVGALLLASVLILLVALIAF